MFISNTLSFTCACRDVEGRAVAKYADANVFLVGLGKNTPDEVKAAYNRFKTNHIDILFFMILIKL